MFMAPILDFYCPVNFLISKFILLDPSSIFSNSRSGTPNCESPPAGKIEFDQTQTIRIRVTSSLITFPLMEDNKTFKKKLDHATDE